MAVLRTQLQAGTFYEDRARAQGVFVRSAILLDLIVPTAHFYVTTGEWTSIIRHLLRPAFRAASRTHRNRI